MKHFFGRRLVCVRLTLFSFAGHAGLALELQPGIRFITPFAVITV
jgi:hypothetical protein